MTDVWVMALRAELRDCLKRFPEIVVEPELEVVETTRESGGAVGRRGTRSVIVLYGPARLLAQAGALRPIIFHELAHLLNQADPDRVFFARADSASQMVWRQATEAGLFRCHIEEEKTDG